MGKKRRNKLNLGFSCLLVLILCYGISACLCLNDEGLLLIAFRKKITTDPFGALHNWNPSDLNPCVWSHVVCEDGKVQILNMSGLALEGTLAPELGRLNHLRALVLRKNQFFGEIPKEVGELKKLELLDLSDNKFHGPIPVELTMLKSLKLLILSEFQYHDYIESKADSGIGYMARMLKNLIDVTKSPVHVTRHYSLDDNMPIHGSFEGNSVETSGRFISLVRRRLVQASNLQASPVNGNPKSKKTISPPMTRSSGSFRAVPRRKKKHFPMPSPLPSPAPSPHPSPVAVPIHHPFTQPSHSPIGSPMKLIDSSSNESFGKIWKYVAIIGSVFILIVIVAAMFFMYRIKAVATIGPWKTGLSGQLQKAFITGVPKLNRAELETACEDFSNIITTNNGCVVFKGTLSSGVEIAVASTVITSLEDWTKVAEMTHRKKIDTLSRVNHKNFVNLIGYCEEDDPFARMLVFEYAPNGSLFEHLHVKEAEHLDWNARMRVIMGVCYCLQYMHHDITPPIAHPNLCSSFICLTDDYAAKLAVLSFSTTEKSTINDDKENPVFPPSVDLDTNVYHLGILILEIISGKLPYSEEQGSVVNWAVEYLNDKRSISYMIDPSLTTFKRNELDVICEVIQDCIQPDPRQRPTMKDITNKLKEVLGILPEQATPRLSPLWWAELEILSVEAT